MRKPGQQHKPLNAAHHFRKTRPIGSHEVRCRLQDLLMAQPAVLTGLIAHLVGTPQQEDIVRTTDRLLRLGQDILVMSEGSAATPP